MTTPNIFRAGNLMRMFHGANLSESHPSEVRRRHGVVLDGRTHPREYTLFEVASAFRSQAPWHLLRVWTCLTQSVKRDLGFFARLLVLKTVFRFPMKDFIFAVAERTE